MQSLSLLIRSANQNGLAEIKRLSYKGREIMKNYDHPRPKDTRHKIKKKKKVS